MSTFCRLRFLSEADISFFKANGYLVKSDVVPRESLQQHQVEVRQFLLEHANIKLEEDGDVVRNVTSLENLNLVSKSNVLDKNCLLLHSCFRNCEGVVNCAALFRMLVTYVAVDFGGMIEFFYGKEYMKMRQLQSIYDCFHDLFSRTYALGTCSY